ncbi:MAG: hypothetical protein ACRDXX_11885, partial [Stackebrandtia sp.]
MAQLDSRLAADARWNQRRDLLLWLALVAAGMAAAAGATAAGMDLGSDAPPFEGRYRVDLAPSAIAAPLVAAAVLWASSRRFTARWRWKTLFVASYLAAFAWMLSLAVTAGADGLTRFTSRADERLPGVAESTSISEVFVAYADPAGTVPGHPPGPSLLLWALRRLSGDDLWIAVAWTALAALTVPLVLATARSACGPAAARRLAPVLVLAPFAVWAAVGPEGVTA